MSYQTAPVNLICVIVAVEPSKRDIVLGDVEQQLQLRLVKQEEPMLMGPLTNRDCVVLDEEDMPVVLD